MRAAGPERRTRFPGASPRIVLSGTQRLARRPRHPHMGAVESRIMLAQASLPAEAVPHVQKPSLLGLTRARLADALRAAGIPEREVRMRVAQLWHWIYLQGATDFDGMLNVAKPLRARLDGPLHARPAGDRQRAGLDRRHAQVADPHAARRAAASRGRRDRVRLYSRERPRHAVRLQPGRLHADLHLLPYRHAEARPQPVGAGDRRRSSWWRATASATFPA